MCGIVGILSQEPVADRIVEALKRLEYRGYDSAGVATLEDGAIARRRAPGKLVNLQAVLRADPLFGRSGIGHTRWATHGKPTKANAHPHKGARATIVHNGIIENFLELRMALAAKGHVFSTQTDSEVVAHFVSDAIDSGLSPQEAVAGILPQLRGAYALAFLFEGHDDLLIGARRGPPLAIGYGEDEMYLGSDALALAPFTERIAYLDDGDHVILTRAGATFIDGEGRRANRAQIRIHAGGFALDKGAHRHFMIKEIHEQPEVVGRTLAHYLDMTDGRALLPLTLPVDPKALTRVTISACGTAYLAGLTAKHWFERIARLPVEIDFASEFRYREPPLDDGGLTIVISQSGETADTLAALRYARSQGQKILSVVNVETSTIAREADAVALTLAGPEIGVASTKAFTCQLAVLACLALAFASARGAISPERERALARELIATPGLMAQVLRHVAETAHLAKTLAGARDVLYLGRGSSFALAHEGALKLKEISYIHAEAYAAGELKHGPIALIDEDMPVIVIAPKDQVFEKTVSNMQEVAARGGRIILIGEADAAQAVGTVLEGMIAMPPMGETFTALVYALPIQMLAYHTALAMGKDVDQPRNLAKSVTVE